MNLSLKNVWLMFKLRAILIVKNPTIAMFPLLAIGYVVIFKGIVSANRGPAMIWILSMAILFNTVMSGLMFSTIPLATEKENKTLFVLLNSQVTSREYMLGTMLFSVLTIVITDILAVLVSEISWQQLPFGGFLLLSIVTTIISSLIGDFVAIVVPSQTLASFITLPLMFIFAIIPMFKSFSTLAARISDATYSGIMMNSMIKSVATGKNGWSLSDMMLMIVWLIVTLLFLLIAYRKKGLT